MNYLDEGFEIIMRGMEIIGNIVGDPPVEIEDKEDRVKDEHPSTFEKSLE